VIRAGFLIFANFIHKAVCLATGAKYFGHKIVERVGTAFVASDDCEPENLVGVRFPIVSDRTKRVICLVTYAALHYRATFGGNGDDWMRAWLEHREAIEALASYYYDNVKFD
jgi:Protein of unknown function (DUF1488)